MAYNTYSTSPIRTYISGTLAPRLTSDDTFARNISNAVNRTWVYDSTGTRDANNCNHVTDKFWLLGTGNLNCTGYYNGTQYQKDGVYDTSKFSGVFTPQVDLYGSATASRVKKMIGADGSASGSARIWWLRSAYADGAYDVGSVRNTGYVYDNSANDTRGVSLALVIG